MSLHYLKDELQNNFRINESEIATQKMILTGDVLSQSYPNFKTSKPVEKKRYFYLHS